MRCGYGIFFYGSKGSGSVAGNIIKKCMYQILRCTLSLGTRIENGFEMRGTHEV